MTKFVQRIFTPSQTGVRQEQMRQSEARAKEQEALQARQMQRESEERADLETQVARARRQPKGRRLLLAATGEQGVASTLGG